MEKNYWLVGGVAAVAVLSGVGACSRHHGAERYQGIVEFEERSLGFDAPGRVATFAVKRGDVVNAGDVLATLDDTLARHVRDARAAELAAAKARAELLHAGSRREDTRALSAQLAAARSIEEAARKHAERERTLSAQNASTEAALDRAETELRRVEGERKALEQKLAAMREGARPQELAAAEAQVSAAAAGLAVEEERLARHSLRALAGGRVVDVTVEPGEIVGAGVPVVVLADTKHPFVDVFVPQGKTDGLSIGDPAKLTVDATDHVFTATVEDVGRRTEFTPRFLFSERERPNLVLRVRVRVDDPEERLHAGVPAHVTIDRKAGTPVAEGAP